MLAHRLRRWINIGPALAEVFACVWRAVPDDGVIDHCYSYNNAVYTRCQVTPVHVLYR